jgi:hypothetical protein
MNPTGSSIRITRGGSRIGLQIAFSLGFAAAVRSVCGDTR